MEHLKFSDNKGFTFLELLIAILLLLTGLLGIAQTQITAIQGNNSANMESQAMNLISDRMEKLIGLEYDHADLDLGQEHLVIAGAYKMKWTVTELTEGNSRYKKINMIVEWNERGKIKYNTLTYMRGA